MIIKEDSQIITKLKKLTHDEPTVSLEEGLKKTIYDFKNK
ncbi:hypothetical protein MBGDF03_01014 [Thermoplasmatales archaeon SCGC AB-540-F20]|nr:hypothetical protein MBGDF03_01014 [Thermoplasmatales archaeon SCGC AB-540-F20]